MLIYDYVYDVDTMTGFVYIFLSTTLFGNK